MTTYCLTSLEYAFVQSGMPKGLAPIFARQLDEKEGTEVWVKLINGLVKNVNGLKEEVGNLQHSVGDKKEFKRLREIEEKYDSDYYQPYISDHPDYDEAKTEIQDQYYEDEIHDNMERRNEFIMKIHNEIYGSEYNDSDIVSAMVLDDVYDKFMAQQKVCDSEEQEKYLTDLLGSAEDNTKMTEEIKTLKEQLKEEIKEHKHFD